MTEKPGASSGPKYREVIFSGPFWASSDPRIAGVYGSLTPAAYEPNFVSPRMYEKYASKNWDADRMGRYIDMLLAFGFNAFQASDTFLGYVFAGWGPNPRGWPARLRALGDYARAQGMHTTLFIWGTAAYDFRTGKYSSSLCPNDPAQREILERHWERQADHAAHFDSIVTHWGDPGGCDRNGCTIQTPQNLHNEILEKCRERNPDVESSFSLWMLQSGTHGVWPGYEGPQTVLDSGVLDADVTVAVGSSPAHVPPGAFDPEHVRMITQSGRRAGVWCWYLADNEMSPSMYVRTTLLKDYFSSIPTDVFDSLEWHTVEGNTPTLNLHNLYVAGKLMQNPQADAPAALREYIAGAFGEENVGAVEEILCALERIRSGYAGVPACDAETVHMLRDRAGAISIHDKFEPAFPLPFTPRELAGEVRAQVEAIAALMEFEAAADEVERLVREGDKEQVEEAVRNLPAMQKPTEYLTLLEYSCYLERLQQMKQQWWRALDHKLAERFPLYRQK